ncbi:hypothetical protein D6201_07935 [Aurantiacibacter aquimixticola]|uniref:LysR family transcriptional regulator n=1 Tax=Aurantiacibacter aquimixticola TaxID=1958945 RepID=A0A419RU31_9SPHN|nr:hypothetical protein D6201_07935 [Aurantiacibacter aquimixticola]
MPLRARRDGWTPARQARFIGMLAQTGCVAAAARDVGMSRVAAYRLRRAASEGSSFARAWNTVLAARDGRETLKWKVTPDEMGEWAMLGPFHITMRRGRFVRARRKPNNTALLRWLAQLDRSSATDTLEPLEW